MRRSLSPIDAPLPPPQDPNLRVQTYYDESIMPRYAKGVTPRSEPQIHGTSPLEIIFEFFAGRQQPGTAGLSLDTHFDKISAQNLSMSFPELLRFVQIMFHRNKFTLQEVQWMLRKAKSAPYGLEEVASVPRSTHQLRTACAAFDRHEALETIPSRAGTQGLDRRPRLTFPLVSAAQGNWHGDISGEQTSLNFVEWLTCVVRLSLVSYGTQGLTPEECIDEIARDMQLHSQKLVKDRIARIARTQAGFGAWKDDATPREIFQSLAINLKRGKPLDDFMLTNHQMLKLQHRLLASSRSRENASWSAFDGPYISMVVPATPKGKFHRFQVIVQNKASNVFNVSFRLDGLPFMEASHTPSKSFCASGLDCICDLRAYCPHLGEFQGDIEVTDLKGHNVLHRVPVYLRVISGGSTRYLVERSVGPGNPIHKTLKAGSLTHRIFTNRDDPVLNRSMTSPTGRNMFVATTQDRLTKSAAALIMPLSVRDAKSNVGTLPLHPSARKGIKSPSRKSMRSMTPKSRDPLDINFTPSSSRIHSPSNITRTTSGTLTGPQSWLNGIALKSGTAFRLSA